MNNSSLKLYHHRCNAETMTMRRIFKLRKTLRPILKFFYFSIVFCIVAMLSMLTVSVFEICFLKSYITSSDMTEEDYQNNISLALWDIKPDDFEDFRNDTGVPSFIVPNIIHFLRFDLPEVTFTDAVCILAAYKNHRPDLIYFHTNVDNFTGPHWQHILNTPGFSQVFKIKHIMLPNTIFGQKFSEGWHKPHASDVTRTRILMQYGGIFLDNDAYVIKNLNKYRHFEMVLNWDEDQFLGTQTLIAHKDARFLKLWLESYRDNYDPDQWYYNAGERPTKTILYVRPELVHRVKGDFGADINLSEHLYMRYWKEWRNLSVVHLLMNHRYYLFKDDFKQFGSFNETNILNYDKTYGEMAREAYFKKTEIL